LANLANVNPNATSAGISLAIDPSSVTTVQLSFSESWFSFTLEWLKRNALNVLIGGGILTGFTTAVVMWRKWRESNRAGYLESLLRKERDAKREELARFQEFTRGILQRNARSSKWAWVRRKLAHALRLASAAEAISGMTLAERGRGDKVSYLAELLTARGGALWNSKKLPPIKGAGRQKALSVTRQESWVKGQAEAEEDAGERVDTDEEEQLRHTLPLGGSPSLEAAGAAVLADSKALEEDIAALSELALPSSPTAAAAASTQRTTTTQEPQEAWASSSTTSTSWDFPKIPTQESAADLSPTPHSPRAGNSGFSAFAAISPAASHGVGGGGKAGGGALLSAPAAAGGAGRAAPRGSAFSAAGAAAVRGGAGAGAQAAAPPPSRTARSTSSRAAKGSGAGGNAYPSNINPPKLTKSLQALSARASKK